MHRYSFNFLLICYSLLLVSGLGFAGTQVPEILDTRVLIDISGSMKQNDPENLRRPALRLLVELLPEESRAGIWTFGQYVNMQVPLGTVDEAWKVRGRKGAAEIHSRGLFTNIEEALRRSTADWEEEDVGGPRHLILLTDGMVDVSKQAEESAASRERILSEFLPRLQRSGARVHTIALSSRADHELMKTLSVATGGWYEQVETAERLQRVFLRLFEKVGRPDAVPLVNNKFVLDERIDEATLLIFRAEGAQPSRVTDPSGRTFGAQEAPANVNWHRDEGYDLLTISDPQPGEWQVLAEIDPDNRVLVVTDLRMHATELPGRVVLGERLPLFVHFTENGEQITKRSFLDLIDLQAVQQDAAGPGEPQPLFDDGLRGDETEGDGRFTLAVDGDVLQPGLVELTLNAQGRTFQRQQKQTFELLPWFSLRVDRGQESAGSLMDVELVLDRKLLQPGSSALKAELVSSAGETRILTPIPGVDEEEWRIEVDPSKLQGQWILQLRLTAITLSGAGLDHAAEPIVIEGRAAPPPPPPPQPTPKKENEPAPEAGGEDHWAFQAMIFGVVNLLVLILAALAVWLLRRKGRQEIGMIGGELNPEESGND